MAIDKSPLINGIYLVFLISIAIVSYKKRGNIIWTGVLVLWAVSVCSIFSLSILPIQIKITENEPLAFGTQFSRMTSVQFKKYFFDYVLFRFELVAAFWLFAFTARVAFRKMKKISFTVGVLVLLLVIHMVYNIGMNTLMREVVKAINAEDFLLMAGGYCIGWLNAVLVEKIFPEIKNRIEKVCQKL